ncbi:MAG: hypothetical protein QOJ30_2583 [Pseudonocardiales bacterium]|nr:hypothetical protein [Pseudonocardiales bacterium]
MTRPGSSRPADVAGGNGLPVSSARCAQTTSRAAALARATAPNPPGPRLSSSRQHVESDATDPNNAAWSASTATSEIVVAPSATATAMSTSTRPGSCRARGLHRPASASLSWAVSVVRSATSATSRDPACDTTPSPSVVAVIRGRVVVACTSKVLLYLEDLGPQQAQFPLVAGHFRLSGHGHADHLTKNRG